MTDKTALLALADRCEKAAGPDRELDACISATLRLDKVPSWAKIWDGEWVACDDGLVVLRQADGKAGPNFRASKWTASLDAAMTLVPEGWFLELEQHTTTWTVKLADAMWFVGRRQVEDANAVTPTLALCAASLRAIAANAGGE